MSDCPFPALVQFLYCNEDEVQQQEIVEKLEALRKRFSLSKARLHSPCISQESHVLRKSPMHNEIAFGTC